MKIYNKIIQSIEKKEKLFALLIDPDHHTEKSLLATIQNATKAKVDLLFIGGSLLNNHIESSATIIKENTSIPLILFPGSPLQITSHADGILLLSLISGRNPDLLIGNHVIASSYIKRSGLEVLPTGYILIEGGKSTSVEYMSNTRPIPAEKTDIAIATAMAGEMLGLKLIYLEAGSGAKNNVTFDLINGVKTNITVPLIVGGGIKNNDDIKQTLIAGADIVVVGTAIEQNPELLSQFVEATHSFKE